MHLVAEILDKQLIDAQGERAGRVDGIVLALREGRPPLVTHVEVSPITLLARFSERLARWYAPHDRKLGPGRGEPFRIEWRRISAEGPDLRMDLDAASTPINALEDWLSVRIVSRLPWG